MIAVPYIETLGNFTFRIFLLKEFKFELLNSIFYDWNEIEMPYGKKYVNYPIEKRNDINIELPQSYIIEFYSENLPYKIINPILKGQKSFIFPYPNNINEFICDCQRCFVHLQWENSIVNEFGLKNVFKQKELQNYTNRILKNINKEEDII